MPEEGIVQRPIGAARSIVSIARIDLDVDRTRLRLQDFLIFLANIYSGFNLIALNTQTRVRACDSTLNEPFRHATEEDAP
jgi:hypothetical protein